MDLQTTKQPSNTNINHNNQNKVPQTQICQERIEQWERTRQTREEQQNLHTEGKILAPNQKTPTNQLNPCRES